MNNEYSCCGCSKTAGVVIAVIGASLLVAGLVWEMQRFTAPPATSQTRVEERLKNIAEVRAVNTEAANSYAVLDPAHAIYRVPIATAKQWVLDEWRDPAAGRSNLISRLDKLTAPVKNPFE